MLMLDITILAAGKGTRMQSSLPKVLQPIGNRPLIKHVSDTARKLGDAQLHLIVGHGAEAVKAIYADEDKINFVEQTEQLGTGHAVQQVLPYLQENSVTLILYGDVPLTQKETLQKLISVVDKNTLGLLTVSLDKPTGYGRIVRDQDNAVTAIVEQKDATPEQLAIQEVNTGIMAVNSEHLRQWLPKLSSNNAQGEFYLTDIIAMAVSEGIEVVSEQADHEWEVMGINNRLQQAELERIYQGEQAKQLMLSGVTLKDPQRFDLRGSLNCGSDVIIDVNCIIEGEVTLGSNVTIGANCILKDTVIADGVELKANSMVEDSHIGRDCVIGPFARLRPGTRLADKAKIGNFVETKKAEIGEGSKVNHLSYVGDAVLGKNVNVGAGTITCNYDGANKHQTTIEDNVFVGSNTALIAPLTLAEGVTVGAGATLSKSVQKDALVITRARRKDVPNWPRPSKK